MKAHNRTFLVFLIALVGGCATSPQSAPPTVNHASIPWQSAAQAELTGLHNQSGQASFKVQLLPRYDGEFLRIGDVFDIDLLSSRDAYLHLYLLQSSGIVMALTENLLVHGGEKTAFPLPNANYRLRAHPPEGINTLLLLATKNPIQGTVRHNFQYLDTPKHITSTRAGAISEIRNQLRHTTNSDWQSAVQDIHVYR